MADPKTVILGLLRDNWSLDFTPRFSSDWYQGQIHLPQITISRMLTRVDRLGFTDNPTTADRSHKVSLSVDVWSRGEEELRWRMIKEVDRILHEHCEDPGGGLDFAESRGWRDLDEGTRRPSLYRSSINVEVYHIG